MKCYSFAPSYYEWHFTDGDGCVLLNWPDPERDLYDYDGKPFSTLEQFCDEAEWFVECGEWAFESGETHYHGVSKEDFKRLPISAGWIMAHVLYEYYVGSDDKAA